MKNKKIKPEFLHLEKEQLERLMELASILGQQNEYQEIVRLVAEKAASFMNAETVVIMMINPRTRQSVKTIFKDGKETNERQYHAMQAYVSGWVIKNNQPFVSPDIKTDPRFTGNPFEGLPIKCVLGVPLRIEGITIGTLLVLKKNGREDSSEIDLFYLEKFATVATPYLRNVQKIQQYFEVPLPETALRSKYKALGLLGKSKNFIALLQAIEAPERAVARC